jgi:cell division protein FtsW (lipid II flippase)
MAAAVILWGGFLAVLLPLAIGGHFGPQKRLLGLTASIGGLLPLAALLPGLVHAYRRGAGDPAQSGYLFALVRRTLSGAAAWGNTLVWPGEEMPPIPGGFNDFMLTLVIGRFGWIAGVLCAAAIAVFLVRMFRLSFRIRPAFGRALARGAAVLFALRFVSGLLLNLGVLPFGYAVPFFSYGGSLMICDLALLGVFLSAWRGSALMAEEGGFTGTFLYRAARWARGMLSKEGES